MVAAGSDVVNVGVQHLGAAERAEGLVERLQGRVPKLGGVWVGRSGRRSGSIRGLAWWGSRFHRHDGLVPAHPCLRLCGGRRNASLGSSRISAEVWDELWSCICHQMTVYSASFPRCHGLTEIARSWAPAEPTMILFLCGAVVAGGGQPHGAGDVRAIHAAQIEELLRLAHETMRAAIDEDSFIYTLRAALAFENVPGVGRDAERDGARRVRRSENCPGCEGRLLVVIGTDGFFATSGDDAIEDDSLKGELTPADASSSTWCAANVRPGPEPRPEAPGDEAAAPLRRRDLSLLPDHVQRGRTSGQAARLRCRGQ